MQEKYTIYALQCAVEGMLHSSYETRTRKKGDDHVMAIPFVRFVL